MPTDRTELEQHLDETMDLMRTTWLLGELRRRRARMLIACGQRRRLAFMRDYALAIDALEAANRAFDECEAAALRAARIISSMRRDEHLLTREIRRELGSDADRLSACVPQ
jgi:hypothetical protein